MNRKSMIIRDSARRVEMQTEVEKNLRPSYRTLFYGLKVNHPHNVAILHPLAFILRRILYSMVIVLMSREEELVFFGVLMILLTCLFFGYLILLESAWEDSLISQQHLMNEVGFYMICTTLLLFCGMIHETHQRYVIGYLAITLICAIIFYNLTVIFYDLLCFVRLLIYRFRVQLGKVRNGLRRSLSIKRKNQFIKEHRKLKSSDTPKKDAN